MKKDEMKLLLAAPVFTESEWTTIERDDKVYAELHFYVNKKDASISTLYLSYKESKCSKIETYLNIDTEHANELYNKLDDMSDTDFGKYIFEFFTKNPKHYDYDADKDTYSVAYSYIGK